MTRPVQRAARRGPRAPAARHAEVDSGGARRSWRPLLLVLAVAAAYANSLSGPFILDDQAAIVQNPQIRDLSRLGDVFWPDPESPVAGRPLASLSFALNYAMGGLDVRGYHLTSIGIHLACVLLAFGVIRRTLVLPRAAGATSVSAANSACVAAAVWAVHPLNSEVVNYLTQRTESLMAACLLATLYASIRAASDPSPRRWNAVAIVACTLGVLSKESMAVAPVLVALYDRVFLYEGWVEAGRRRAPLYAGLAASWVVLAFVLASAPRAGVVGFSSGVSPWTYLLNQSVMITHYLRLTVWPRELVVFYGWPAQVTVPEVAPYLALIVALFLATVVALGRAPALGLLGAWFFITLAPASSVVPIATEVGAERRMYLPLLALVVAGVVAARALPRGRSLVPSIVAVTTVVALVAGTFDRNREYASALTLARTVVERRPTGVSHHILGEQLVLAGRADEAIAELQAAVANGNSRAGYPLGAALFNQGKSEDAVSALDAFVATANPPEPLVPRWLEPPIVEVVTARGLIAQFHAGRGDWAGVVEQAELIMRIVPAHPGARRLLADARFGQERWSEAEAEYRTYLASRPNDVDAWINLGVASVATARFDEALSAFTRVTELDPGNERARRLLAMAREDQALVGQGRAGQVGRAR